MPTTPIAVTFTATQTTSSQGPAILASFTPPLAAGQTVKISLVVTDDAGQVSAPGTAVVRVNAPPVARVTTPPTVGAGQSITIDGSPSTGSNLKFAWTVTVGAAGA